MILTARFINVDELEIKFKNPLAASLFNTRKKTSTEFKFNTKTRTILSVSILPLNKQHQHHHQFFKNYQDINSLYVNDDFIVDLFVLNIVKDL